MAVATIGLAELAKREPVEEISFLTDAEAPDEPSILLTLSERDMLIAVMREDVRLWPEFWRRRGITDSEAPFRYRRTP